MASPVHQRARPFGGCAVSPLSILFRSVGGAFLVLACCGPKPPCEAKPKPVCGLSSATQFPEDQKFLKNLLNQTPPEPTPPNETLTADELDAHCRSVWQQLVEDRHCGDEVIENFCNSCQPDQKKDCSEGNGRGIVKQHCREISLETFTKNYATCQEVELCAGKIQMKSVGCKAKCQ